MLKNSVHVEPVWFSLDNLTLCGRFNYRSMVFHAIKKISNALKLFSFEGDDFFLIVFLKYRDKLSTKQTSSDKLEIPCGTKFLRVLIFTSFRIFPSAIRKNKFPQKIIKRKHFSRKNLLQSIKYTLTKIYYTKNRTTKSCLFNYNSPPQFRNKTVYNELVLNGVFYSFNPRRTMTRSHISRNRDFLESISF